MDCIYNKVKYQKMSSDVNTCGDHVCHYIHRMLKHDMDLQDYYIYMKNIKRTSGYTYDEIVSVWVAKYLKTQSCKKRLGGETGFELPTKWMWESPLSHYTTKTPKA